MAAKSTVFKHLIIGAREQRFRPFIRLAPLDGKRSVEPGQERLKASVQQFGTHAGKLVARGINGARLQRSRERAATGGE